MAKDPIESGRELLKRGDQAVKNGDLADARVRYQAALCVFRNPALLLGEAHALRGMAVVTLGEGMFSAAMDEARTSQAAYEVCLESVGKSSLNDKAKRKLTDEARDGLGNALLIESDVLNRMGRSGEAEAVLEKSRAYFEGSESRNTPAAFYIAAGKMAMRTGQMKEAEDQMRTALKVYKTDQDRIGEVGALLQMAELHRQQLKVHKAEEALNLARSIVLRLDEPNIEASVWMALGSLHLQAMRLEKARASYERALGILKGTVHLGREGLALMGLGEVQSRDGDPKALSTMFLGTECLVKKGSRTGFISAMLRVGEHGLRNGDAGLALISGESARRMAREDGQVLIQGRAMRIIVKSLASLRESRATLAAALAREAVAGAIQKNAVDVAQYYRRRAPKPLVAELDALTTPEILSYSERQVSRVLRPILASLNSASNTLNQMEGMLSILKQKGEGSPSDELDEPYSEELTHDEDSKDFESFDHLGDPPSEATSEGVADGFVEILDAPPPVKPVRHSDATDLE